MMIGIGCHTTTGWRAQHHARSIPNDHRTHRTCKRAAPRNRQMHIRSCKEHWSPLPTSGWNSGYHVLSKRNSSTGILYSRVQPQNRRHSPREGGRRSSPKICLHQKRTRTGSNTKWLSTAHGADVRVEEDRSCSVTSPPHRAPGDKMSCLAGAEVERRALPSQHRAPPAAVGTWQQCRDARWRHGLWPTFVANVPPPPRGATRRLGTICVLSRITCRSTGLSRRGLSVCVSSRITYLLRLRRLALADRRRNQAPFSLMLPADQNAYPQELPTIRAPCVAIHRADDDARHPLLHSSIEI